jgi:hypothetical protein
MSVAASLLTGWLRPTTDGSARLGGLRGAAPGADGASGVRPPSPGRAAAARRAKDGVQSALAAR